MNMIKLFTGADSPLSLYEHTGDLILKRSLDVELPEIQAAATLTGITSVAADDRLAPEYGAALTFFDGYSENSLKENESVCLVSEDMLARTESGKLIVSSSIKMPDRFEPYIDPELNPGITVLEEIKRGSIHKLKLRITRTEMRVFEYETGEKVELEVPIHFDTEVDMPKIVFDGDYLPEDITSFFLHVPFGAVMLEVSIIYTEGEIITKKLELEVIGTVSGVDSNIIYCPFWTVIEFLEEFEGSRLYTERLSMIIADNRELSEFKSLASLSFSRTRPVGSTMAYAMTVYDSTFYETIEPLLQNSVLVEIAMPVVYIIAVAVGFLASTVLTRQRKSEFAVIRSVGIHKRDVFTGVLSEHIILSLTGAVPGYLLTVLIFNDLTYQRPAILLGCYLLGTIFAAARVAGTNVLKVMKEKES